MSPVDSAGSSSSPFRIAIEPDLSKVAEVREWLDRVVDPASFSTERVFDVKVAVSEAVANAIEHAASAVEVEGWVLPDRLIVEVANEGAFRPGVHTDDEFHQRGLGLPLMVSLADQVHVSRHPEGKTLVSLTFFFDEYRGRPLPPAVEPLSDRDVAPPTLGRWAWCPIVLLVVAIGVLYGLRLESVHDSPVLLTALNTLFVVAALLIVAYLAARSYLFAGSLSLVALGSGALVLGIVYLLSGPLVTIPNEAVTISNIGILVAGALFVLSAWWALTHRIPQVAADPTWRGVALPYAGGLVFTALLTWLTVTGRMPDFYVEGKGYTVLREPVLGFGVAEVLAAAALFGLLYRRVRSRFLLWCSAGLAMIGVALGGALITGAAPGTALAWVTRAGQWLGGAYLLVATLGIEGRGAWILPLERSLREAEDRYRNLVDMSPDAVLVHAGGRYVFANPAAARVFGADSPEDIIGTEGIAVVHPDFREVVQRRVDQVYSGAIAPPEECRLLRLDGTPFEAEVTRTRVRFDGRLAVQTVVRDISERKRAAETLRESEERYRIVAQFTYDWEHWRDPAGHFLYSSPSAERVTGYTADEFIRDPDLFLRIVHPDDRDRMRRHAVGAPSCSGIEYRLRRRDGEERWIDHACQMITDSEGRPLGRRGSDRDITERKLAEEQLEAARRRAAAGAYARRLIEVSLDPLVTISPDGTITDVNEATIKVTGRARDELIGTDFSDYFTDPESARAGYREAFARGSVTDYPLTIRDQDGKLTDVLYNASVYRDQEGQVLGVFAAARDITALRMLEEQRALVNRLQNALLDVPAQASGVQFGHLYRSATREAQVGGDFYDVFELKEGCIAVLIGDVSGHGVEAARIATLVKDVIHAFAHQHSRPGAVLRETNALLIEKHIPGFVTLFLGTLDPKDGTLTYCSAGHPNALLRGRSGEIELLEANSPPLGVFVDMSWRESEVRLEVDDLLFLYTDGVIEARRDGEFFGQEGLMAILKGWTGSSLELLPQTVLTEVLAFSGGSLFDDVAILALRLTADAVRDSSDAMLGIRGA